MGEWQPIEDAPQDGSELLILTTLGVTQARFAPGEWHDHAEGREYDGPVWVCCDDQWQIEIEDCGKDGMHHGTATHWMPLPDCASLADAILAALPAPAVALREPTTAALKAVIFHNDKRGSNLPVPIIDMCRDALAALPSEAIGREAREKEITRLATIEECALVAEGFDAACDSKRMKLFVDAGLVMAIYKRDGEIGAAIRELKASPLSRPTSLSPDHPRVDRETEQPHE